MDILHFLLALMLLLYGGVLVLFGIHMWLYQQGRKQKRVQDEFLLEQWRKPWW